MVSRLHNIDNVHKQCIEPATCDSPTTDATTVAKQHLTSVPLYLAHLPPSLIPTTPQATASMASYPLHRIPTRRFNKPGWLMAPDASMLPIPVFNGTASLSVQRQSLIDIRATAPFPSPHLPSTEPWVFPPPPTYTEVMEMNDDLPLAEAIERARSIDPIGYAAEAIHPEHLLPPSFDDIARMEPHLSWEEVMKRAGNIDQAALIRDTISRQGPDRPEAFEQRSGRSRLPGPQTMSRRPTTRIPETINETYNQLSMSAEEAPRSSSILSSSKDKIEKELKALSELIAIWLHTTITNGSMTQSTTDSASTWKSWSTFSETVIVIQAIMETLTLDYITIFHALVYIRRLFGGYYIREDEAYLQNAPTIVARVFFAGCLLGFKYCQDSYSERSWASTMGIDHRTVGRIGRHALHGLRHRLDISPNDWKSSLEDLHRFAATCSFPTESDYTRTVVTNILDELKIDAPPGIPLRARTSVSEDGNPEPPSITYISGIFTGAVYSPKIILKVAEVRPAAPWGIPNDSLEGRNTRQIGQRTGLDEHLLSVSMQPLDLQNVQDTGGKVSMEHRMGLETRSFSMQRASTENRQISWPSDDSQRIPPDDSSFGALTETQNDLLLRYGTAMVVGGHIRPSKRFLETQQPPLVSRSVQDHRMIWQSDNGIPGQCPVSGGLIFDLPNETNIWAFQRGEWLALEGSQIAPRTSLW